MAKTVAVDFDGVLHPYTDGWCGYTPADEPPIPGAAEALAELCRLGFLVVVFSTRCDAPEGLDGTTTWLAKHDLLQYVVKVTHEKPAAVAYIDDRAVAFRGDWKQALVDVYEIERNGPAHGAPRR